MFRERKTKQFPPGTFIPTPARVMAILQLCLAFTCVLWYLGYPFMGEHFEKKSKMIVYERVMNDELNFPMLKLQDQNTIARDYAKLTSQDSFIKRMKEGIAIFLLRIPKLELAWIVLAMVIPLLLLKKVEGATAAMWLLPIAALTYSIDNLGNRELSQERLYPSEKLIISNYVKEPFSSEILKQREQLLQGWKVYLVKEWAKEEPLANEDRFNTQVAKGEFAFYAHQLLKPEKSIDSFNTKHSPLVLLIYVLWNVLFCAIVSWKISEELLLK